MNIKTLIFYRRLLLLVVCCLVVVGLVFVYAASSVFALERFGSPFYFLKKQLVGLALGIIGIFAIRAITIEQLKKTSPFLFLISLLATAMTLLPYLGQRIHGSSRWLAIAGFGAQPSELLKISFIIYFAYVLSKKRYKESFLAGYLPALFILLVPVLILLRQPDFGLSVTLCMTALIMIFFAQFQISHILLTVASLVPVGALLIWFKPYRLQRVLTFLDPWQDPKGAGFQVIQSLIAIGSGGFTGVGIGQSKQKFFYLPMQHTDFIFSIIAEETGFVGSMVVIVLYLMFLYVGIKIAQQLDDLFSQLVVLGFVIITNLQALINIAVTTGLVPTKGIGLPFISYGNTALIVNLWMIGIILAILHHTISTHHHYRGK